MADRSFVGDSGFDANSQKITNLGAPTVDTDAATRGFARNASNIDTGTLGVARGGTGIATYAVGDLLVATATTPTLGKLSAVTVGNVLISAGVNTQPIWGKVDLTAAISGVLPIANGGTGTATGAGQYAVFAGPTAGAGAPAFRALTVNDIPVLNQSTTGTAANVTGTVAIANGGTGAITAALARTALGATTVGANLFTLTDPGGPTFLQVNSNNSVSALSASTFRTAIGAGTGDGSVTSVSGTGTVSGLTLSGTVTGSGSLTLGGTLSLTSGNVTTALGYTPPRNFGAVAVQAVVGTNQTCTTAQFVTWLTSLGAFAQTASVMKCSWDYAGNNDISDTGFGTLELAGCIIETFTDGSQYIIRVTSPSTGTGAGGIHEYVDHGAGYSPGWRRVYTSALNGNITGNAATATVLQTSRTIWGQGFTGAADIGGRIEMRGNSSPTDTLMGYSQGIGWNGTVGLLNNLAYVTGNVSAAASYTYIGSATSTGSTTRAGSALLTYANGNTLVWLVAPQSTGAGAVPASLVARFTVDASGNTTITGTLSMGGALTGATTITASAAINPQANDTVTLGATGNGFQSLQIQHNANRAVGISLVQTLTGQPSPRLFFNNTTDAPGAGNAVYQSGSNTLVFTTGATPGTASGTNRWSYNATSIAPATTNVMDLGTNALVWANVYATTFVGALTGNAATATSAATWTTGRTITIGATGKSVNGSANVSWSLAEIGALGASAKAADSELLDGIDSTRVVYGGNTSGSNSAAVTQNLLELAQYKSGFWDVNGAAWTPTTGWYWGATFAHTSNTASYNFAGQLAFLNGGGGDNLYARTIAGGAAPTATSWSRLLSSGNYNSYAPTLTGTGASGTWGISISGNAATVSNIFRGGSGGLDLNTLTASGFYRVNNTEANRPGDYGQLLVIYGGSDTISQIYGDYATGTLHTRSGNPSNVGGAGAWTAWRTVLQSNNFVSLGAAPLASPALTGVPTAPTANTTTSTTQIATTNFVAGAFSTDTTSGTLDWNDVTNTRPGTGPTLLLGSATNGFGVGNYYHPVNFEYSSRDGTGNVTQLAIAYGSPGNDLRMRGRYGGTWSAWTQLLNASNSPYAAVMNQHVRTTDSPTFVDVTISSDRRLKSEIAVIDDALSITKQLTGYTFVHNARPGVRMAGVMAQDLVGRYDTALQYDVNGHMSVSYLQLVPLLVNATNAVDDKVEALQRRVAELESQLEALRR